MESYLGTPNFSSETLPCFDSVLVIQASQMSIYSSQEEGEKYENLIIIFMVIIIITNIIIFYYRHFLFSRSYVFCFKKLQFLRALIKVELIIFLWNFTFICITMENRPKQDKKKIKKIC